MIQKTGGRSERSERGRGAKGLVLRNTRRGRRKGEREKIGNEQFCREGESCLVGQKTGEGLNSLYRVLVVAVVAVLVVILVVAE